MDAITRTVQGITKGGADSTWSVKCPVRRFSTCNFEAKQRGNSRHFKEDRVRLIDADVLYEKTAEWEAQALHMVEVTMNDEDKTEWRKWTAVLNERSAFKHDIADAPTIEPQRMRGKWEVTPVYIKCSECGECYLLMPQSFCPNCGAEMEQG